MNTENIEKIINLLNSRERTSKADLLQTLTQAVELLASAYPQEGEGPDSKEDTVDQKNNIYEYSFQMINAEFERLFNEIENTRSGYMPYNLLKNISKYGETEETTGSEVLNETTVIESAHNAFYRMVGLPTSDSLEVGYKLPIINTVGELKNYAVDEKNIESFLDARQASAIYGCSKSISHYDMYSQLNSEILLKETYGLSEEYYKNIIEMSDAMNALLSSTKDNYKENYRLLLDRVGQTLDITGPDADLFSGDKSGIDPDLFVQISKDMRGQDFEQGVAFFSDNLFLFYGSFLTNIYMIGKNSREADNAPSINDIGFMLYELVYKKESDMTVNNLENIFFNYSSLLFPMVQDGRIAKCINDGDKVIAEPFLPKNKRVLNRKTLKSSLLETIIRIRMDVISGTKQYISNEMVLSDEGQIPVDDISGSTLGYIESLLIVRMLESLAVLAKNTRMSITAISKSQKKNKMTLFSSCITEKALPTAAIPAKPTGEQEEEKALNAMLLIEDSLMLVLGTTETQSVLDLQASTRRDSSISNSSLMPSLLNIVQVPRNYINKRSDEIKRDRNAAASAGTKPTKDIETSIGIISGIGMVDFLVVAISLLTIDEVTLVALLTRSQRELMFNELKLSENFRRKVDEKAVYLALSDLTAVCYTYYNIFIDLLKNI